MKFSLLTTLFAATALATPTPKNVWKDEKRGLEVRGLGDQGDGFYGVKFDANGVGIVQFTPWAKLNHTAIESNHTALAVNSNKTAVEKRWEGETTCSGEWAAWWELDEANIQLARNSDWGGDSGNYYYMRHWGWVHHAGVTAFFCPYDNVYLGYDTVIWMTTRVSQACGGSAALGYHRNEIWPGDQWWLTGSASVGRTYRGRNFCTPNFYG